MGKKIKEVDAFIAKSPDFAQPILTHLRELVHNTCPEVEETIKWGCPHFMYHGMFCNMAAFKQHCSFGFWNANVMSDPDNIISNIGKTGMGHFGAIHSLSDLPADKIMQRYIKEAMRLKDAGIKTSKAKATTTKELVILAELQKALAKNKAALKTFEAFSYTNKKDYVEWITEAKTDATREKRLASAIEWMAEGKIRNWKYVKG